MSEIINMNDEFYEVSKNEPIDYAQIVQERIDRYNAKNKPFENKKCTLKTNVKRNDFSLCTYLLK